MKKIILIALVTVLAFSACKKKEVDYATIIKSNTWILVDYKTSTESIIIQNPDTTIYTDTFNRLSHFTLKFPTDSTYDVLAQVNEHLGKYQIYNNCKTISFIIGGSTNACCDTKFDSLFFNTLPQVTHFEVTDQDLKLFYNNKSKYIHFAHPF